MQAAQIPQVQQSVQQKSINNQVTGAAATPQKITTQQQQSMKVAASKFAAKATWIAFLTTLFSLIAAAVGGFIGMQSINRQMSGGPLKLPFQKK